VPVALAYNPSYSGGKDQEDHSLKSAGTNSLRDPISKKEHITKRADGEAQGVDPKFKPRTTKEKKSCRLSEHNPMLPQ
jgi:hypothetical protein